MTELSQPGFPRLEELEQIDPFDLQPGVMIGGRFCVLGGAQHSTGHWSVVAADTHGEFGRAPAHRVELVCVQPHAGLARLSRGLAADDQLQRSPLHVADLGGVRLYVLEAESPDPIPPKLRGAAFLYLVETLARLAARLRAARVDGLRFSRGSLFVSGARFSVRGLGHLLNRADASRDFEALLEFLTHIDADGQLPRLLEGHERSFDTLAVAASKRARGRYLASTASLPASPTFVGREDVLEALDHALADARVAHPRWVRLEGVAGIGKSTVVREFVRRTDQDTLSLWGVARLGSGRDVSAVGNALAHLAERLAQLPRADAAKLTDRLSARTGPFGELLVQHAPRLAEVLGPTPALPEIEFEEQYARYLGVVSSALSGLGSQRRPLVLVIDDFELADKACRDVLEQLVASCGHHHTLVVTCSRPGPRASTPVVESVRLELSRLARADVEQLVRHTLPGEIEDLPGISANLRAATEALPLRLWTKLRDWVDDGVLSRLDGDGPWSMDPGRLREANHDVVSIYAHNFDRLTGPARAIATVAAARGGPFNATWIADVTGEPRSVVERSFAELRHGALMVARSGNALEFAHEQARQSLLSCVDRAELTLAHQRLSGWAQRSGDLASAAFHAEHARDDDEFDGELAILHLKAASGCLRRFDLGAAHFHFTAARRRCGGDPQQLLEADEGLGDVALLRNATDEAIERYTRVVREADPVLATRVGAKASYGLMTKGLAKPAVELGVLALSRTGEPGARRGVLARVLGLVRALGSLALPWRRKRTELDDALCHLYVALAGAATAMDNLLLITVGMRTAAVARGLRSPRGAAARALQAAMVASTGRYQKARTILDEAEEIAMGSGDPWARGAVSHFRAFMVDFPSGDLGAGLRHSEASIAEWSRCGDLSTAPLALAIRVIYSRNSEPHQRLISWLDEADEHARRCAGHLGGPVLLALRIALEARRTKTLADPNQVDEALERFLAAPPDADHVCALILLAEAGLTVADHTLAQRAVEGAVAARSALGLISPELFEELWYVRGWSALATFRSDGGGGLDEVRRCIRKLERASKKSPRMLAFAALLSAQLAQAVGDEGECRAAVARLVDRADSHRQTHLLARGHQILASVAESRDVLVAAEHERRARALLGELGLRREPPALAAPVALPPTPAAVPASAPPVRPVGYDGHESAGADASSARARPPLSQTGELSPDGRPAVVLAEQLGELSADLRRAARGLDLSLLLESAGDIEVDAPPADLRTIALNLVLAGRDALAPVESLTLGLSAVTVQQGASPARRGVRPGEYGVIELVVRGRPRPAGRVMGLSLCRQLAARHRGHVTLEGDAPLSIRVYLPLVRGQLTTDDSGEVWEEQRITVLHPDARVRRTLVSALAQLGYVCDTPDPAEFQAHDPEIGPMLVLGEGSLLASLEREVRGHKTIEIVKRGEQAYTAHPKLSFPFVVRDLQRVL